MTILLTADCMGGVWTYTLDLIRVLPQHHFVVATMGDLPNEAQRAAVAELPNATLCASGWKLEWMPEPWDDVRQAGEWLLELERQFSPDVIHLNGYAHAVCNFKAPKLVVAHSCVCSWWRAVKGEDAPNEWDHYFQSVQSGLEGAALVVSPTKALLQELHQIYGAFGPTQVIWNGSAEHLEPIAEPQRFILAAGRLWDEAKNIRLLDAVAPLVNAPIRVAGSTQDGEFTSENLEMLGFLTTQEMSNQMEAAAIWAHPAKYEPFGLAVLEAAHHECALVLSDIPTLRELWQDAAIFVSPDDKTHWAQVLQQLLDQPEERAQWARRTKERASHYSLDRFGAQYERAYRTLKCES